TTHSTLQQVDAIYQDAAELHQSIGNLVKNVETIQGLNQSLSAVVTTSVGIRSGLAEIMLLEPAVRQLANSHREIQQLVSDTEHVDVDTRAKRLIVEHQEKSQEPVFVSQKP
ncbi:MAG: hypothetical protein ACIALR_09350, partial [Blastopirellula sp. JB062]